MFPMKVILLPYHIYW